ncbi:MAG: SseB family protein [Actinobacteria bacterium]|nr:SseB family protein [Actinomycetota bacterium]
MNPSYDDAVALALDAAVKDNDRISDLLDELSRGRLWLPLPDDGGPVTDGSAVQLPTVVYLGSEFVPAFTSAAALASYAGVAGAGGQEAPDADHGRAWTPAPGPYGGWTAQRVAAPAIPRPADPLSGSRGEAARRPVPHVVVPTAALARRLPPGVGIALNPGAAASVPIYPEGVTYLAAAEWMAGDVRIRLGQPPVEPEGLLREISAGLRPIRAARHASRAWLSVPGQGEGLIISVALEDPADQVAQQEVLSAIAYAAEVVGPKASFPVDVTFPGEHPLDDVDQWIADHAAPFHLRA